MLTMGGFLDEAPISRSGRIWRPDRPDGRRGDGCPIYRWRPCRAGTADGDPGRVLRAPAPLASPPLGTPSLALLELIRARVRPILNRANVAGSTRRSDQNCQPSCG